MSESRFRKGDRVAFEFGMRTVEGVVKEDRGPIGIKGRRLYLVEFRRDSTSNELAPIELPAKDLQFVQEPDTLISVSDAARMCGKRKQTVFKVLKRLGIQAEKQRSPEQHGQVASYINHAEFELLKVELNPLEDTSTVPADIVVSEVGFFYLIQLEPDHDPGRFKVGFTSNVDERLRSHRCSAPLAKLIKTWPCRSLWERTAIDSVCRGRERLHTEVFRTDLIDQVVKKCDEFFALMPSLFAGNESDGR